ncbi:MAG: TIGR02444 family protein [Pseudomonadota bacterium]
MTKGLTFWDFSLSLYAQPEVADCCLQLQDRYAGNVNLFLWSIWLGQRQVRLTDARLAAALELIQQWDVEYVQVLRQLRRKMKHEFAQDLKLVAVVRESIKGAELKAEKREQDWLEKLAENWSAESVQLAEGENQAFYLNYLQLPQLLIEQIKSKVKHDSN